jgi:SHS2 domain-containing protein
VPFEFVDDAVTSDVMFHASGDSLAELFVAAVDATTATMLAELDSVRGAEQRRAEVEAPVLDLLLLRVLEEVIFLKDTQRLLLRAADVCVDADEHGWRACAELVGEPIDHTRHALVADVKAVTLHGLYVEQRDHRWHAGVTLDV